MNDSLEVFLSCPPEFEMGELTLEVSDDVDVRLAVTKVIEIDDVYSIYVEIAMNPELRKYSKGFLCFFDVKKGDILKEDIFQLWEFY